MTLLDSDARAFPSPVFQDMPLVSTCSMIG
jgi:hypothetical protein